MSPLSYHICLWAPVMLAYIPSTILHISIVTVIVAVRKHIPQYNSLFYRLFVIQGVLDNFLIFLYIAGRILIRERMAGNDFVMSTNSWIFGVFPKLYYFGTVHFFFNSQVWGVIVQSVAGFVAICAPESRAKQLLDSIPDPAWWLIKTTVPMANPIMHAIREPIYFERDDKSGTALLYVPLNIIEAGFFYMKNAILLATQSTIFTVVAILLSSTCHILVLKRLIRFRRTAGYQSIAKYRQMKNITAVCCMLFLSICTMTAYNLLVATTAVKLGRPAHIVRHLLIIPVLLMTFVQPWMLLVTDANLRRGLWSSEERRKLDKKQANVR